MKILIIEPVADLGGVSQYILSILKYRNDPELQCIVATSSIGPLFDMLEKMDVPTTIISTTSKNFWLLSDAIKLRRFIKKEKIDIVHAHTTRAGFVSALALIGLSKRFIFTGHGWRFTQINGFRRFLQFFIAIFICRSASVVTVLSRDEYDAAIRYHIVAKEKMFCTPIRIDTTYFSLTEQNSKKNVRKTLSIPEDAVVIGFVASAVKEKDPDFFIKVCNHLAENEQNAYFLWVGGGVLVDSMLQKIDELNLSSRFIITGTVPHEDVPKYLSVMNVFFMSSCVEVFPISLLEAMSMGCRCIAPDVGAISEIIYHNVTGLIYKERNPELVSKMIFKLVNEKEIGLRAQLHSNEKYGNPEKLSNTYFQIYRDQKT